MLMRSPVSPSLMRWELRPEPAGRRRLGAAYLAAASGAAAGSATLGLTVLVARQCRSGGPDGFGCMAPFFHGLGLSIVACLVVTLGFAVLLKLGLRFVLALLALAAPVLLAAQLLSILGLESRPYALIAMLGVPAGAAWLSARVLRDQPSKSSRSPAGRLARLRIPRITKTAVAVIKRS